MQPLNLKALNQLIAENNPFVGINIDRVATIWSKSLPDVKYHNQHVLDLISSVLEEMSHSKRGNAVQTIAIKAGVGMGKTQVFSRIHDYFYLPGKISFSYLNAGKLHDSRFINSWFRKGLISDLARINNSGVSQLQEIAAHLISGIFSRNFEVKKFTTQFDKRIEKYKEQGKNLIEMLYEKISLADHVGLDPYLIKALLWTLSKHYSAFAIRWLSGDELDRTTAEKMKLPPHTGMSPEQCETNAINENHKLLQLFSTARPLVIGFDELEDCNFLTSDGFSKPQVIMDFVKKIYDSVEGLSEQTQGILIVTSMMDGSVLDSLEESEMYGAGGVRDRISTANNNEFIELQRLNPDLGLDIARTWLKKRLFEPLSVEPPYETYPFDESKVLKACSLRPTPREFLRWCAKEFQDLTTDTILSDEDIFKSELQKIRESHKDENFWISIEIVRCLKFAFQILSLLKQPMNCMTSNGEIVNQVKIEQVCEKILVINDESDPHIGNNDGHIDFKILGREVDDDISIGISVYNGCHHHTILAALKRLSATGRFGLTRSCLIQLEDLQLKGKMTLEYIENLKKMGGKVVKFTPDELRPLWFVYLLKEKVDLEEIEFKERTIEDLVEGFEIETFVENPILLEVLSHSNNNEEMELSDYLDEDDIDLFLENDDDDDIELDDDDIELINLFE
jgi:hypothetical protein